MKLLPSLAGGGGGDSVVGEDGGDGGDVEVGGDGEVAGGGRDEDGA